MGKEEEGRRGGGGGGEEGEEGEEGGGGGGRSVLWALQVPLPGPCGTNHSTTHDQNDCTLINISHHIITRIHFCAPLARARRGSENRPRPRLSPRTPLFEPAARPNARPQHPGNHGTTDNTAMLSALGRRALPRGAGKGRGCGDGGVASPSSSAARRRRRPTVAPPTARAAADTGDSISRSSRSRTRTGGSRAASPVAPAGRGGGGGGGGQAENEAAAAPPAPTTTPLQPRGRHNDNNNNNNPYQQWRRELAHLAPLLRDRARPWALPLVLALCYERNDDPARAAHRALGGAQWSELLARRAAAERAVAAAAHATAAAHARVRLLRRLVGLVEDDGDSDSGVAAADALAAGQTRPAVATSAAPLSSSSAPPPPSSPTSPPRRRWLTAQEAEKERTTLSEARKAGERALKALAAAAAIADEVGAAGDADFASRRAPRMAALARGLAAHARWLQRRALRDVLSAGRRNEAEAEAARALLGPAAAAVAAQRQRCEEEEEDDGGDDDESSEDEDEDDHRNSPRPARLPPLHGLVAAYRGVALGCFDCYSDPDLERRAPGPGLPSSAGRRFPRLVPRRALFPSSSSSASGSGSGSRDGGQAPSAPPFVYKRRLAAARRILAWVDEAEAAGGGGEDAAARRQPQRQQPLAEVEEALAEGAYGVEPLPPMDVLLERAVALEMRIEAKQQAKRRAGGQRGGRAAMLPPPVAGAAADAAGAAACSSAWGDVPPPPPPVVARGWKTGAWSGD